jgi:hypothetical protein
MRYMMMVRSNEETEAGIPPSEKILTEMGKYNDELTKAGMLLGAEGLRPSSEGARVKLLGEKRTVIEGPFDPKELIGGYWLIQVRSHEEALAWAKRVPNPTDQEWEIEVRRVFEAEDFGQEEPSNTASEN